MKMKNFYTTLILVTFALAANAQTCKYRLRNMDSFEGKHHLETKYIPLWQNTFKGNHIYFSAIVKDGKKTIEMEYSTRDVFKFQQGKQLLFLFNDEEVAKMSLYEFEKVRKHNDYWVYVARYRVNDDINDMLLYKEVSALQFFTDKGKVQRKIEAKNKYMLNDIFRCIQ